MDSLPGQLQCCDEACRPATDDKNGRFMLNRLALIRISTV